MIKPVTFWQRALVYFLCWTFNIQPVLANVIVNNSQHNTSVNHAGNGVEVVNIATPNANGLSHNQYQQFNVDPSGLILNNSTAQVAQSQLGGYLQNNPNLHGQAATVILNEVTGASRSQLQGYTEVFGQSANVILTNPYGITCNGCGFINTPRVTLSTGNPLIENGNVTGFDVSQGSVSIEGLGLDATHQSYFDIITRTAELNAEIHANDLNIVTGKNQVSYQSNEVTATASENEDETAPELSIDSSSLGGMYAGRIALIATEAGVGVNVGNLAASQGEIHIDANGQITLGKSSAQTDLTVNSQAGVTLTGSQYARRNLSVEGKTINVDDSTVVADKQLELKAPEQITLEQSLVQAGVDGNTDSSDTELKVTTQSLQLQNSEMMSLGLFTGNAAGIDIDEQSQLAAKGIVLSGLDTLNNSGSVYGQDSLQMQGLNLTLEGSGKITGGDISLTADSLVLDNQVDALSLTTNASQTTISKDLAVDQASLTAETLDLNSQVDALTLNAEADSIHINNQLVLGQASLQADTLDFNHRVDVQNLDVNAGSVNIHDKLVLGKTILQADSLTVDGDSGVEAQSVQANLKTVTVKNNGLIKTSDDLHLSVADQLNNQGKILSLHDMVIDGDGDIENRGLLYSANDTSFYINKLTNFGAILTGNDLLVARNAEQARMASLENSSGRIESLNGNIGIYADSVLNHQTTLSITTSGYRYYSVKRGGLETGNSDYDVWTDKDSYRPATRDVGYGHAVFNGRFHKGGLYQVLSLDILPLKVAEYESHLNASSGASFLLAKNRIDINAGQIVNDASHISGNDVTINASQVTNRGYQIYRGATFIDYQLTEAIRGAGNVQALFDDLEIDNSNGTFPLSGVYIFNSDLFGGGGKDIHYRRIGKRENVPIGPQTAIQSSITATNHLAINAAKTNNSVMNDGVAPTALSGQPTDSAVGVTSLTESSGRQLTASDLLPQGSDQLFVISTEPDSHYLIETDPILTDKMQFLGSDYFMSQVDYAPEQEVQFLGDAYYDTQVVTQSIMESTGRRYLNRSVGSDTEQMAQLIEDAGNQSSMERTGRRYLNRSVGSDTEQMAQLIENAGKEQKALELTVGISLTAEQVASLTHDIIWYEYIEVDGRRVLAPRLYLAKASADDISNGALLAGGQVDINTDTLTNERGDIQADKTLSVDAQGDIINKSGEISGENVSLTSARGSLINSTEFQTDTYLNGWVDTHVGRLGSIRAGNDLTIGVGKDIVNQGASFQAVNNLSLNAGENVEFSTIQKDKRRVFYQNGGVDITQSVRHQAASTQAKNVEVNAGRDITLSRAQINADNNATLTAAGDVNVLAVNDSDYSYSKHTHKKSFGRSKTTIHESLKETVKGSSIAAGGDITIKAQKFNTQLAGGDSDIQVVGSNLNAGDEINLSADGDVILSAQQYREYEYNQTIKKGFGGLSGSNSGNLDDATLLEGANTIAASHININSGNDIGVIASTVSAGGDVNMQALDEVLVTADNILRETQQWSEKSSFLSGGHLMEMSSDREGMQSSTAQGSQIASNGSVNIQGGSVALVGSDVVAGENTVLKADTGNLDIRSAQNSIRQTSQHKKVSIDQPLWELATHPSSAIQIVDGQIRIRIGKATYDQVDSQTTATTQTGSNVLANNDVSLSAASDLTVTGSRISADSDGDRQGDLSLAAENILIQEAKETEQTQTKEVHGKAEASVVIQNQYVETAKAVLALQKSIKALKKAKSDYKQYQKQLASLKETLNSLKAEYAAKTPGVSFEDIEELADIIAEQESDKEWYVAGIAIAAEDVTSKATLAYKQAYGAMNSSSFYGFNAGVRLDVEGSRQNTESYRTTSVASALSGQNVSIQAGHDKGQSATIQGSVVQAQDSLSVSADEVNIQASREKQSSSSKNESAHIGVSMTLAAGITVDGSYSRNADRSGSQTYTNSVLDADKIQITSDGDTNVKGATVQAGSELDMDVGGDLNVASVQNRSRGSSHGGSVSASLSMTGPEEAQDGKQHFLGQDWSNTGQVTGAGGGVNVSSSRNRSRETVLTSITSGGEANIQVGGNTDIKGATIATVNEDGSDAGKLSLETGTLSYADLSNTNYNRNLNAGINASYSYGNNVSDKVEGTPSDSAGSPSNMGVASGFNHTAGAAPVADIGISGEAAEAVPVGGDNAKEKEWQGETSSYSLHNTSGYNKSKTLATLGQGSLIIHDTANSDDTERLNRDIQHTEKDLFSVERKQGDFDMTVDHRLLSEDGRNEIAEEIYRTNLGIESLADVALKDSVTLSNVLEHADVVQKELDVEMLVASLSGESTIRLNNLDAATAAQKQQAINDYAAAYAQVFGISIESALVIAVDKSMGGAHYMGQNGSNIVINDAAMKNAQAYMRTLAHEVAHGLTAQGAISDKGSSSLNEEYSDLIGGYAEDNFAFALEHAGLGDLNTGYVNSHIGSGTVLMQNNWNTIKDVPVSQLDFEIVRDSGYKSFSQLVQSEPRLNEMTLGQMDALLDNVTYLMTYGDGVSNSPAAASEKMAYVIEKLKQQGIDPKVIQFLKDNSSRMSDIIGPDNDQYNALGRALINVTTMGVAGMIRDPSTSERVQAIQEVWDNAFTAAGLPSAGAGLASLGADIAQLLGKKGIALLSKDEFIATAKSWDVDVTQASKQEMDGLYQEYAQATGSSGSASSYYNRVPTHNTRTVHNQLDNEINPEVSCGPTSCSMILDTKGIKNFTPDDISNSILDSYTTNGTTLESLQVAMREAGLKTTVFPGGATNSIRRLQRMVDADSPAIVRLNLEQNGHFVVLDEIVTMPDKSLLFKIRDPWKGVNYGLKQSDFEALWQNGAMMSTKTRR